MTPASKGGFLLTIYVVILAVLVILPIAVVLGASLSEGAYLAFPPQGLTLKWYRETISDSQWTDSFWLSLEIGCMVALLATLIGVPAAIALRNMRGPFATGLQTLFLSPLMLPTILIGLSLLQFYQKIGVATSALAVTLGHVIIACPYVIRLVLASFAGVDPNLERAASILGAGPIRRFMRVTFPMIRHGILAGALFSFIVSLDDVNIALFLSDVHTTPLPVQLFSYIEQNADPLGAAVASILVLLASAVILICDRIVGIEWLFGIKQRAA
jgi:putative spermidine/putrescine transport system permease protein